MKGVRSLVLPLLIMLLSACAHTEARAPLSIWAHSVSVPVDDIEHLGVMHDSLSMRFQDSSRLTISLIDYGATSLSGDLTAPEFAAQIYGDEPLENSDFEVAHNSVREGLERRSIFSLDAGLTVYLFDYDSRSSAYVTDETSDQFLLMIEATGRSLDGIPESITRR